MACNGQDCVAWFDQVDRKWVVYSSCQSPCFCPLVGMKEPAANEPSRILRSVCLLSGKQDLANSKIWIGDVQWADSWVMQRRSQQFVCLGCEWSLGNGIVKRSGFPSGTSQAQQVLSGERAEAVLLGGLANGAANISQGLPDPWIIGFSQWGPMEEDEEKDYRMTIAGLTSFKVRKST